MSTTIINRELLAETLSDYVTDLNDAAKSGTLSEWVTDNLGITREDDRVEIIKTVGGYTVWFDAYDTSMIISAQGFNDMSMRIDPRTCIDIVRIVDSMGELAKTA